MDKHIKNLIEIYFNDIPYSKEIACAQTKIETALNREFEKLTEFLWLIYYLFYAPLQAIFILVYMAALCGGTILIYKKYKHSEKLFESDKFDTKAYIYFRDLSERYAKRRLNGIALFFP